MIAQDITELIGRTPLLRLDPEVHRLEDVYLYAKLELFNPFGSIKDRAAWGMLREDLDTIAARGQTLIEASSGNTAKALQVLAAIRGLNLLALTNRTRVAEIRDVLQVLGAELRELPGLSECPDPTVPHDVFSTIDAIMAAAPGTYYHASQYTNPRNVDAHYHGTGQEILDDLPTVDCLIGGLGTSGSTRGVAARLKEHNPALNTIGVVSATGDFIPGIRSESEMWEVGLFDRSRYDDIIAIDAITAVDATLTLVRGYGILSGPTGGAAYAAALRHLSDRQGYEGPLTAVVLICDRLEPYLSYLRARSPHLFGLHPQDRVTTDTGDRPRSRSSHARNSASSAALSRPAAQPGPAPVSMIISRSGGTLTTPDRQTAGQPRTIMPTAGSRLPPLTSRSRTRVGITRDSA